METQETRTYNYSGGAAGVAYDINHQKVAIGDYVLTETGEVIEVQGFTIYKGGRKYAGCHEVKKLSPAEGKRLHVAARGDDEYTILWGT